MAAHLDDMFSFCVDPDKVVGCVEERFIDNIKVRTGRHVNKLRQMRRQSAEAADPGSVGGLMDASTSGLNEWRKWGMGFFQNWPIQK